MNFYNCGCGGGRSNEEIEKEIERIRREIETERIERETKPIPVEAPIPVENWPQREKVPVPVER